MKGPLGPNLIKFGFPLAIAMGLMATFNLVDLLIIGRLPNGKVAAGALVICDMLAVIGTILTTGISNASVAVISRFFGKDDRRAVNHATWNSIAIVLVLSLVFGAIGLFGAELLVGDMVGADGETREIAVTYLRILVGNSWTIFFMLHLTAVMRALGSAKWPTIILIVANALNIFLDVFMVYGPGPAPEIFAWATGISEALGIPRMGVDGAAWATVIARAFGCVVALIVLLRLKSGPRWVWSEVKPTRGELWRILRIGTPSSAQFLVRISSVLLGLSLVTRLFTTTDLAAYSICIRLDMLALFMAMGWASAAATFVGANLGAGKTRRAIRSGWLVSGFTAIAMVAILGGFLTNTEAIVQLFVPDAEVAAVGREYLWIVGLTYPMLGVAVVLSHALQGATDTVSSFVIDTAVIVLVQAPLMIVAVAVFDMPRTAIWYAIGIGNILSAIGYAWWYRRGAWTRLEVEA